MLATVRNCTTRFGSRVAVDVSSDPVSSKPLSLLALQNIRVGPLHCTVDVHVCLFHLQCLKLVARQLLVDGAFDQGMKEVEYEI